jgi:hypothetical protein
MSLMPLIKLEYQERRLERIALGPDSQVSQLRAFIEAADATAKLALLERERRDEYWRTLTGREDRRECQKIAMQLNEWIAWAETQITNKEAAGG